MTVGGRYVTRNDDFLSHLCHKKEPRTTIHGQTAHKGVYSLVIADEAPKPRDRTMVYCLHAVVGSVSQKLRNQGTGLWSTVYMQSLVAFHTTVGCHRRAPVLSPRYLLAIPSSNARGGTPL